VIADNGSTDETSDVVEHLGTRFDPRLIDASHRPGASGLTPVRVVQTELGWRIEVGHGVCRTHVRDRCGERLRSKGDVGQDGRRRPTPLVGDEFDGTPIPIEVPEPAEFLIVDPGPHHDGSDLPSASPRPGFGEPLDEGPAWRTERSAELVGGISEVAFVLPVPVRQDRATDFEYCRVGAPAHSPRGVP
jgi:glycosyltransferase involved in cell wall biosynthesis